jgi:hypothetical protein
VRLQPVHLRDVAGGLGGVHRVGKRLLRRVQLPQVGRAPHRRGDEHEPGDPLRVGQRQVERRAATHRVADERRRAGTEVVEHGQGVVDVGVRLGLVARPAVAAPVEGDGLAERGEDVDDLRPATAVGDAGVQQQDGFAVPGGVARELGLAGGDDHAAEPVAHRALGPHALI